MHLIADKLQFFQNVFDARNSNHFVDVEVFTERLGHRFLPVEVSALETRHRRAVRVAGEVEV